MKELRVLNDNEVHKEVQNVSMDMFVVMQGSLGHYKSVSLDTSLAEKRILLDAMDHCDQDFQYFRVEAMVIFQSSVRRPNMDGGYSSWDDEQAWEAFMLRAEVVHFLEMVELSWHEESSRTGRTSGRPV